MGYWGWRPLVFGIFIGSWVVGCNMVNENTSTSASPSAYPNITLTVGRLPTAQVSAAPTRAAPPSDLTPQTYVVQPDDTLASIADQFDTSVEALQSANGDLTRVTPGQTLLIPAPLPLSVQPPTCYQTRPGNLLCLGLVDNPLDFPVESVVVEVSLLQADGSISLTQRSTIEQPSIDSGSFAPYQATFEASDYASANARLISAARGSDDLLTNLLIQDISGATVDGRLVVRATLYNPGTQDAEIVRAFVTLLDDRGRVIGYRVLSFASSVILAAGGSLPISIDLTPLVSDVTPQYALYVEAYAATESP